jgi:hypothetical protein
VLAPRRSVRRERDLSAARHAVLREETEHGT